MNNEGSSLQRFKFEGWSKDKIIEKYETVLASREKQITDLAMEIGVINERITTLSEQNSDLKTEVEMLKTRLQKRVE
jgi:hypothetical protein